VPALKQLAPGVIQIDANYGFAPLALQTGRAPLIEKARSQGIAALAIINSYHFAALWPEVEALAEHGLVAFAWVCAMSYVAPAGGIKPLSASPTGFGFGSAGSASGSPRAELHRA
jgi:LDH2 family malate/lactate/ureidoglycolate dehydrogenase